MRFNIGQKILAVTFIYPGRNFFTVPVPFLYDNVRPAKIIFKVLEVKEHHKVFYSDDPEKNKKYDGYRLTDVDGVVWNNQYPTAHYGQLDDRCDRLFELDMENMSRDEIRTAIDNEENVPTQYELLEQQLDRIHRGLKKVNEETELYHNLQWLWNEIENEAKKQFPNFKIELISEFEDHPDIKHVKVIF